MYCAVIGIADIKKTVPENEGILARGFPLPKIDEINLMPIFRSQTPAGKVIQLGVDRYGNLKTVYTLNKLDVGDNLNIMLTYWIQG